MIIGCEVYLRHLKELKVSVKKAIRFKSDSFFVGFWSIFSLLRRAFDTIYQPKKKKIRFYNLFFMEITNFRPFVYYNNCKRCLLTNETRYGILTNK